MLFRFYFVFIMELHLPSLSSLPAYSHSLKFVSFAAMDARLKEEEYKFRAVAEFAVPLILVKYTKEGESKGPHQSTSGDGAEEMQQSGAVNQSNDRSSQPLTESIIEDVPKSLFDVNDLEDSYATVEHPVVDPEELDRMIGFVGGIDHNSPGGVSSGSHNRRTSRSMSASGLGVSVLSNTAQSELYAYLLRLKQEVENGTRPLDADTKEVPVQRFSADAADAEEDNSQDHDNLHLMASSTLTFNTSKLESDEDDKEEENQRAPADDTLPQTMTGSALSTTWQPVLSYSELLEGISMLFVALRKSQTKCRHLKDRYHSKSVELRALQLGSGASSSLVEAFETAKLREANEKIAILQTELSRTCTRASSLEHALKAKTAWYNAMWFPQDFGGLFPRSAWIALAHVLLGGSVLFTNWWRRLFGVLFGRKAPPRIPRPSQTWRVRAVFVV